MSKLQLAGSDLLQISNALQTKQTWKFFAIT
jgi:hypothetical protein